MEILRQNISINTAISFKIAIFFKLHFFIFYIDHSFLPWLPVIFLFEKELFHCILYILLLLPFFNLFPGLILLLNILFPQYFLRLNKQLITVLMREVFRFFTSSTRKFFTLNSVYVGIKNLTTITVFGDVKKRTGMVC